MNCIVQLGRGYFVEKVSIAKSDGYELPNLRLAVVRLLEPIGGIYCVY